MAFKKNITHTAVLIFAFIFFGFLWGKNIKKLISIIDLENNQISVIGEITDKYRGVRFFEGFVLYYSYTSTDGTQYIDKTRVSPSFWVQKKIGDTVSVIYHKDNNNIARIDTKYDVKDRSYIVHVALLSIGVFVTVIYLIKSLKK